VKRKTKAQIETILFSAPAVILVCLMMYIPFLMSGYYSMTEWNGISKDATFVGLKNFKTIFWKAGILRIHSGLQQNILSSLLFFPMCLRLLWL